MDNHTYSIVISTFGDKNSANKAAKALVECGLAACVQIFPIDSIYRWQGEICSDSEVVLFIKSRTALFDKIKAAIRVIHTYDVPEIVQIPITDGLPEYLKWIDDHVEPGHTSETIQ